MKIIAVIPAYNEEKVIGNVVRKTKKYVDKIIVVDDGSKDETSEVAKKSGALVIKCKQNKGVGYATKLGLKKALEMKPNIIVFLDGDGQHDPKYIPMFIQKLENVDYVAGKRSLSNYPINRKIGNWGLTFLTNLFCPTGIRDTECGYRILKYDAAKKIEIKADRYGREMDFAYSVWKNKLKTDNVEILVPHFQPKPAVIRGFKNFFHLLGRRFS